MQLVNSKGRVLFHVHSCYVMQNGTVTYGYLGEGFGGFGVTSADIDGLVQRIKQHSPSARVVGELPQPTTE